MNWKRFKDQAATVQTWLRANNYSDNSIMYKIFVLILRGAENPYVIMAAALKNTTVRETAKANLSIIRPLDYLPDNIYEQIARWVLILPRKPDILGEIYETLALDRRIKGLYYTPQAIIDFILAKTVSQCDVRLTPKVKILDPACGCGSFLLKAYDLLFAKFVEAREQIELPNPITDLSDLEIHNHILNYNLWGADIDSLACDITFASLVLKNNSPEASADPNIIVTDSLNQRDNISTQQERNFWSQQYHYVIGNPPYLSFGLRGAKKADSEYLDYLRSTYSTAQYKLSIYVLFMQRGIEMLSAGGKLGFIVPDSFLLGRYFSKIREYILENTQIDLIAHISSPIFKKATTGYLTICVFTKRSKPTFNEDSLFSIYQLHESELNPNTQPQCQYQQTYFNSMPHKRFRIFFSEQAKQLVDRLDRMGVALKEYASGHSGIRAISGQSSIISTTPISETWQRGLISGSQVHRYGLEYQGHWLDIDPIKLYKGGWDERIIKQRKILARQTGYYLTCSIDNHGYFHLNNIHSFVTTTQEIKLDYLLLLLNSRLLSFYYHIVTMEFGRTMAQCDIETLELLPIVVDKQLNQQAANLVAIMETCVRESIKKGCNVSRKSIAFNEYLNQLVYHAYNLSDDDIRYIEEYEFKLSKDSGKKLGKRNIYL